MDSIEIIYLRTREGDPARQLLVQLYTDNDLDISDATSDAVPKDFTFDLVVNLMAKRPLLREHEQCKLQLAAKTKEAKEKEDSLKKKTELLRTNPETLTGIQKDKELVEGVNRSPEFEKRSLEREKRSLQAVRSTLRQEKETLETEKRTVERDLRYERSTKDSFSLQLANKAQDLEEIKSYMRMRFRVEWQPGMRC